MVGENESFLLNIVIKDAHAQICGENSNWECSKKEDVGMNYKSTLAPSVEMESTTSS